jgi:hypothetical protein
VESIYDHQDLQNLYAQRELLAAGRNVVVDSDGIDWWDMLFHVSEREWAQSELALRFAEKLGNCDRLVATRPSFLADALHLELNCPYEVWRSHRLQTIGHSAARYAAVLRSLTSAQIRQVLYDKYDATYRWRRRFAFRSARSTVPVVILPSAYGNVSRTGVAYARLLPEQQFLLVPAREHAAILPLPANVRSVELAAYAGREDSAELTGLTDKWRLLEQKLSKEPALRTACELGLPRRAARFLRWGLAVRDAWKALFKAEPVVGCLSGDDVNPYTRLPLILAVRQGIPTVACHHGAFDGRLAYTVRDGNTYLAKGAMEEDFLVRVCGVERNSVCVGAPAPPQRGSAYDPSAPWLTYFSEPYEIGAWRTDAIYREILPRLCLVARAHGKQVVLKLHPFESAPQRRRVLQRILTPEDNRLVSVIAGSLSPEVLGRTWCAVAGVSSAALDCALAGIPTFLCGWLRLSHMGYAEQFARFDVGKTLHGPDELGRIPDLMASAIAGPEVVTKLISPITPEALAAVLVRSGGPSHA